MTVAASKGGIYRSENDPRGYDINVVRKWRDVGTKAITGLNLYEDFIQSAMPKQIEVGIGNTCGLECKHCFLGYGSGAMGEDLIPLHILKQVSTDFVEKLHARIFCVTDRDALTPNRSVPFFEHLAALRRNHTDLKFGGVTNGLAIHKYADDLERIGLDFLDISLDGLRHEHDLIRGAGNFDRTLTNLRLALERKVADRVIISTTLTKFNFDSIIQMIRYLIVEEQVQWFDIGPLMAVKMQASQLDEVDTVRFLSSLSQSLANVQVNRPTTIFFEICAYCAAFIPALIDHGWLVPERIRQDCYSHLYQDIRINDSITVTLRPELIPEYWRHTLRITADGYVVGGCEPLTIQNYSSLSVGNIKDEPVEELYRKSLSTGSPFYRMMRAYDVSECRGKACFAHCLGGDSLLAESIYGNYNRKDPNCYWEEYNYVNRAKGAAYVS